MSTIASKNLYELLGNDPELDPDREPEPPTKVIDKPVQRTGKRNAGAEGPARDALRPAAGGRGGRNENFVRGDQAGANNRADQRDDGLRQDRHSNRNRDAQEPRGQGRGRGGHRGRGRGDRVGPRDDRHSRTNIGEHAKQAAHGWGNEQDGNAELADEKAGDAIANAEAKDDAGLAPDANAADPAFTNGPDGEAGAEAEEDKTKSYDQYLAEQAEKRLALGGGSLEVRKANEGSKQKFPEGKAFAREGADDYMAATGGKARKAKEIVAKKEHLVVDGQYYAAAESGDRGSRGGRGRGGRGGRGEYRGDRGDRGDRGGRGRGRGGDFRGGAPRGNDRGPRGGASSFNATDDSAFPALGA